MKHQINGEFLSIGKLNDLLLPEVQLELSSEAIEKINHSRTFLENRMVHSDLPIYGVNTGFGALCKQQISSHDLETLQRNLVMSHACGMGEPVSLEVVRLMLVAKIHALALGYSGIRLIVVQRLIDFFNTGIFPVVYEQGSLGASGDLVPLAHLCLPLMGEGQVWKDGKIVAAKLVLDELGLEPLTLQAKEGLALLNGTQFMLALGLLALKKANHAFQVSLETTAVAVDAFQASIVPFQAVLHQVRRHKGQQLVAAKLFELLHDSPLAKSSKSQVQDPYSFRCMPQVAGPIWDTLEHTQEVLENELNAATDNPLIFPDENAILSGGNFHGQCLAFAGDFMAIALAELANISERRIFQLVSGLRGLPEFLVANPGLNSGLMIPQYLAAALVSQNKQWCTPASVDSIVSSNGQEDHVSMGANAMLKLQKVVENVEKVIAIEWLCAVQALEFRRPGTTSPNLEAKISNYRKSVQFLSDDRIQYVDLHQTLAFLFPTTP